MENLEGAADQRNCLLMGIALGASAGVGLFFPYAFGFTGLVFSAAAPSDCF